MMGNFNFGATGIVLGLSPTTILSGAGLARLASPAKGDGGIPFIEPPYADDQKIRRVDMTFKTPAHHQQRSS
jgi:hypothetical protein